MSVILYFPFQSSFVILSMGEQKKISKNGVSARKSLISAYLVNTSAVDCVLRQCRQSPQRETRFWGFSCKENVHKRNRGIKTTTLNTKS